MTDVEWRWMDRMAELIWNKSRHERHRGWSRNNYRRERGREREREGEREWEREREGERGRERVRERERGRERERERAIYHTLDYLESFLWHAIVMSFFLLNYIVAFNLYNIAKCITLYFIQRQLISSVTFRKLNSCFRRILSMYTLYATQINIRRIGPNAIRCECCHINDDALLYVVCCIVVLLYAVCCMLYVVLLYCCMLYVVCCMLYEMNASVINLRKLITEASFSKQHHALPFHEGFLALLSVSTITPWTPFGLKHIADVFSSVWFHKNASKWASILAGSCTFHVLSGRYFCTTAKNHAVEWKRHYTTWAVE